MSQCAQYCIMLVLRVAQFPEGVVVKGTGTGAQLQWPSPVCWCRLKKFDSTIGIQSHDVAM